MVEVIQENSELLAMAIWIVLNRYVNNKDRIIEQLEKDVESHDKEIIIFKIDIALLKQKLGLL